MEGDEEGRITVKRQIEDICYHHQRGRREGARAKPLLC